jgi:hypothetical protein
LKEFLVTVAEAAAFVPPAREFTQRNHDRDRLASASQLDLLPRLGLVNDGRQIGSRFGDGISLRHGLNVHQFVQGRNPVVSRMSSEFSQPKNLSELFRVAVGIGRNFGRHELQAELRLVHLRREPLHVAARDAKRWTA